MKNTTRAVLIICNGNQTGQIFELAENDRIIIGRDKSCQVQIFDEGISRKHSLVEWKDDCFVLIDLGSTNGSFVNNEIVIYKPLQNHDVLKVGQTEIEFKEILSAVNETYAKIGDDLSEYIQPEIMERVNVQESFYIPPEFFGHEVVASENIDLAGLYLSTIYEVSNLVNAEHDINKLFAIIMDKIIEVFKPDRGFMVLQKNEDFKIAIERNFSKTETIISSTILKKTIKDGVSILSANAMLDDRFCLGMSIVSQQINSVMSVPLESSQKVLGAIYVDSVGDCSNRFKKTDLDLLTAIGKQAGVAIERNMLFAHYLEKEKIKQELKIAQNIQKSLLPRCVPKNFVFDLVAWNLPCDETGGDYYDYFELPEDRIGIAIGDVCGHGVGAALIMATARAYLKAVVRKATEVPIVVTELNQLLSQDMDADKFMTLLYGELDAKKMVFRYASAGHEGPILYRKKIKQFNHFESSGIPLGIMEDFIYEDEIEVTMDIGDILILSTDGIVESKNLQGEQFGAERFEKLIQQSSDKSANQIIKDCYDQLQEFCKGAPQCDDLTLFILKFDPNQNTT